MWQVIIREKCSQPEQLFHANLFSLFIQFFLADPQFDPIYFPWCSQSNRRKIMEFPQFVLDHGPKTLISHISEVLP